MKTINVKGNYHRLVSTRFPPINLFEEAETYDEMMYLAKLEGRTCERLKQEMSGFGAIAKDDWVFGDGSSVVMAPFCYTDFESRFTTVGSGAYYAANNLETALKEVSFHKARFLAASNYKYADIELREYTCKIKSPVVDITKGKHSKLVRPELNSYGDCQRLGGDIRSQGLDGVLYKSQRNKNGLCVAMFKPKSISLPKQGKHFKLHWENDKFVETFELKAF